MMKMMNMYPLFPFYSATGPPPGLAPILEQLVGNLMGLQHAGNGQQQGRPLHMPGLQLYGNPGDYAWGHGGLDAVISQLLSQVQTGLYMKEKTKADSSWLQVDGATNGPPPMKKESIDRIPTVEVTQENVGKCSGRSLT